MSERTDPLPPMPPTTDRQPHGGFLGYMESNADWAETNNEAVEWLADNHVAIRAALEALGSDLVPVLGVSPVQPVAKSEYGRDASKVNALIEAGARRLERARHPEWDDAEFERYWTSPYFTMELTAWFHYRGTRKGHVLWEAAQVLGLA